MNTPLLDCVEVLTGPSPVASVVWLHGLGADGHDFEPIVPALALPASLPVRFVFPHAPVRPVTLNAGMRMRAWFDIYGLNPGSRLDEAGIRASAREVDRLVAREQARGIPSHRIALAGFSQGGAIALHAGLSSSEPLAGIMGLSTFLPRVDSPGAAPGPAGTRSPIFLAHGTLDEVVPFRWGEASMNQIKSLGYEVEWRSYAVGHGVDPGEISDIRAWLTRVLGNAGK